MRCIHSWRWSGLSICGTRETLDLKLMTIIKLGAKQAKLVFKMCFKWYCFQSVRDCTVTSMTWIFLQSISFHSMTKCTSSLTLNYLSLYINLVTKRQFLLFYIKWRALLINSRIVLHTVCYRDEKDSALLFRNIAWLPVELIISSVI